MPRPNREHVPPYRTVKHICVQAALTVFMIGLAGSLLTCDKNNPPFAEREVSGTLYLPTGATITPSILSVISFAASTTPANDGTFRLKAPVADKQQLVFASTASDNVVLMGYVDPSNPSSVEISPKTTVIAMTLLNPLLIGSSKDQRDQYIAKVQEHSDFWALVATVETLLVTDPENLLNGDAHPEVMSRVVAIMVNTLEAFGSLDNPREYYAPNIEDADGGKIAFVNPTFLYYGASVQGSKSDLQLVYPEASLLSYQLGWPPVFQTQPKRTEYELGDGQFDIIMYRGMDFGNLTADAWVNFANPEGRASLANLAKGVTLTIDLLVGYAPEIPVTKLKLNWAKCATDLTKTGLALVSKNYPNAIQAFYDFLSHNSDAFAYAIWQQAGDDACRKFLRLTSMQAGQVGLFLKGYSFLVDKYPYFRDLGEADTRIAFFLSQENGVLEYCNLYDTPDQPTTPTGPSRVNVGEDATYQSSATHTSGAEVQLAFFWGDGEYTASAFVPSGTPVEMSHTYNEPGSHRIYVRARTETGTIGLYSVPSEPLYVLAASGSNQPPGAPSTPTGPTSVQLGVRYSYTTRAWDPDGGDICVKFTDGVVETDWSSPVPSGMAVTITKSWSSAGMYNLKAKAKDAEESESDWSQALQVSVAMGNNAPNTPGEPTGPASGTVGVQYEYVAGTTDPEGDDIRYIFDWADGTRDTTQYIGSGVTIGRYKTWWSANTYGVKVKAEDDNGAGSNWSVSHNVRITSSGGNNPPNTPATPSGPSSGEVGRSYAFSSSATDPDGDQVAIRFDWGDGTYSDWSSYVSGGTPVSASHSWGSANTFQVKAQAKDDEGAESNWSSQLNVTISARSTWTHTYGGYSNDGGDCAILSSDGCYVVVGYTSSFGAGSGDAYVIKTNSLGDTLWSRTFGGTRKDFAYSVVEGPGGAYVIAGYTYSYGAGDRDVWLFKVSGDGTLLWSKTFGGAREDFGRCVRSCPDGGYIIAGGTKNQGDISGDVWLVKTDANGTLQWSNKFGGDESDWANSVDLTGDGGFLVVGGTYSFGTGTPDSQNVYVVKVSSSGQQQSSNWFGGTGKDWASHVDRTSDGGFVVTASTFSYGERDCDVWLLRLNSNGDSVWSRVYSRGIGAAEKGSAAHQLSDGGYIVVSGAERTIWAVPTQDDLCLLRVSADGSLVWLRTYGGGSWDTGESVHPLPDGGFLAVGVTSSAGAGGEDVWLVRTDSNGEVPPNGR